MEKEQNITVSFAKPIWFLFAVATAMVGYQIHHGVFWTVMNFIFSPLSWAKWLICHNVNMSIIKQTFSFFTT